MRGSDEVACFEIDTATLTLSSAVTSPNAFVRFLTSNADSIL